MFEDRTYDNIMSEMMNSFSSNVRTDEGSLAFNSCAKQAEQLENVYEDLEELRENLTPLTMDLDHLISYSAQTSVSYRYATAAIVRGVFQQEIEEGTQFTCGDYTYTSGAQISDTTYNYYLTCDEEGAEPNGNMGVLEPVEYIEDYLGGEITEIIRAGTDDEDVEAFRERILNADDAKPFGGNKAYYRQFIDAIDGVGGCKPKRRGLDDSDPWIYIWIVTSAYGVPPADFVSTVQDIVDPVATSGEGDGMAPMCHHVSIIAATGYTIDVSANITLEEGVELEDVQDSIRNVIDAYMLSLREDWEDLDFSNLYVRIAQIEARILSVLGVLDVSDVELNGDPDNITLSFEKIPFLGEVVLNV